MVSVPGAVPSVSLAQCPRLDAVSRSSSYSSASHVSNDDLDGLLCHLPSFRADSVQHKHIGSPGGSSVSPAGSRERGVDRVSPESSRPSTIPENALSDAGTSSFVHNEALSSPSSTLIALPAAIAENAVRSDPVAATPSFSEPLHESIVEAWPGLEPDLVAEADLSNENDSRSKLYDSVVEPWPKEVAQDEQPQRKVGRSDEGNAPCSTDALHVSIVEEWPGAYEVDGGNSQIIRSVVSSKLPGHGVQRAGLPIRGGRMDLRLKRQQDSVCSVKLSEDGDVVVVDDVDLALDVPKDNDIVVLGEQDEIEFGEGQIIAPDIEEAVVTAGREMFARSRNNAMIWGSTRSAGARSSTHEDDSPDDELKRSFAAEPGVSHEAVIVRPRPSCSNDSLTNTSLGGAHRALTLLLSRAGRRRESFESAMRSLLASLSKLHDSIPVRRTVEALQNAVCVSQIQEENHREQQKQFLERQEKLQRLKEKQNRLVATSADEKAIKQLSLVQAPARTLLPPVSDSVIPWSVTGGKSAIFSSGFSFGNTIAVVAALFAEFGDIGVKLQPRVGISAAPAAMDCVLSIVDRPSKLHATLRVAKRIDGSGVDVRVSCHDSFLSRKRRRAAFSSVLSSAESAWRSVGLSADETRPAMTALASMSLGPRFSIRNAKQLYAVKDCSAHCGPIS